MIGRPVAMVEIERTARLFPQDGGRAGIDARPPLLEDDAAFLRDLVRRKREVRHAIGLDLHHPFEPVGGDELEIAGIVPAGERILPAAIGGDDAGKFAGFPRLRPLEQQMFDEMGDAGFTGRLIDGAGPVPHHVQRDRRPPVDDDDAAQPVGEGKASGDERRPAGLLPGRRRRAGCRRAGKRNGHRAGGAGGGRNAGQGAERRQRGEEGRRRPRGTAALSEKQGSGSCCCRPAGRSDTRNLWPRCGRADRRRGRPDQLDAQRNCRSGASSEMTPGPPFATMAASTAMASVSFEKKSG